MGKYYYDAEGWGDASLGIGGCIYWQPVNHIERTLKYDPYTDKTSLIGITMNWMFILFE